MPNQSGGIRLPLAALVVLGVIGGDFLVRHLLGTASSTQSVTSHESSTPTGWWTLPEEDPRTAANPQFSHRAFEDGIVEAPGIATVPGLVAPDPHAADIQYFPAPSAALHPQHDLENPGAAPSGRAVVEASNVGTDSPGRSRTATQPNPEDGAQVPVTQTEEVEPSFRFQKESNDAQRPQELPSTPHASPIPENSNGPATRSVIDRALPNLSKDEQQIWQDTLQGLSPDMVRELLEFRRQSPIGDWKSAPALELPIGPTTRPRTDRPSQSPPVASTEPTHANPKGDQALLQRATQIVANNILNAETPGFRASEVMLVPSLTASANDEFRTKEIHVALDMTPGKLRHTGRPLDLAISGAGFFSVTQNDRLYYTRYGRFSVSSNANLCLEYGDLQLTLEPKISIPGGALRISVSPDGTVQAWFPNASTATPLGTVILNRFPNPRALAARGALFQQTDRSGAPNIGQPGSGGVGWIQHRFLERSNVQVRRQKRIADRFRTLSATLHSVESHAPSTWLPPIDPSRLTIQSDGAGTLRR